MPTVLSRIEVLFPSSCIFFLTTYHFYYTFVCIFPFPFKTYVKSSLNFCFTFIISHMLKCFASESEKIIKNILKYLQRKSKSRVACYAIANWTLFFSFPRHPLILQHFKTNCYWQPGAVWKKSKEAKNAVFTLHCIYV